MAQVKFKISTGYDTSSLRSNKSTKSDASVKNNKDSKPKLIKIIDPRTKKKRILLLNEAPKRGTPLSTVSSAFDDVLRFTNYIRMRMSYQNISHRLDK